MENTVLTFSILDYLELKELIKEGNENDWIFYKAFFATGFSWNKVTEKLKENRKNKKRVKKVLYDKGEPIVYDREFGYALKPDLSFLGL
jgi:hypothetical protein